MTDFMEYFRVYGWIILVVAIIGSFIVTTVQESQLQVKQKQIELDTQQRCWTANVSGRTICFEPQSIEYYETENKASLKDTMSIKADYTVVERGETTR